MGYFLTSKIHRDRSRLKEPLNSRERSNGLQLVSNKGLRKLFSKSSIVVSLQLILKLIIRELSITVSKENI